ncbi:phospholipase A and acyltransferase 4 [Pleuronectes platessa]|uniref:phospholipase A and acyltransferase 4 n=1 Tax=Pleuronectes platessa TaxID=8262 RepID=UPI00232A1518|nr:phospholipase A and acyltransferase 4 [Pleuronectes platessa]
MSLLYRFKEKPGDLIEISRDGPYQHWYFMMEPSSFPLSFPPCQLSGSSGLLSNSNGKVVQEKLTDVVRDDHYQVKNQLDEKYKARDPSVTVKEACAMVGSEPQYNVVTNNCEHFANKMRYGVAESRQVCI